MKLMANRRRSERKFNVGDMVYLKLQPYRQTSVNHGNQKLQPKFFWPFPIAEAIGKVACPSQLPAEALIHDAFHESQLRPAYAHVAASPTLPPQFTPQCYPHCILNRKLVRKGTAPAVKLLIQWQHETLATATWEFADVLRAQFPLFSLEDKEVGDGVVDTNWTVQW